MVLLTHARSYVAARPFAPFRLHMASGETYDNRHPEMIKFGKSFLLVFSFEPADSELIERWETVSLLLIESISSIEQPAHA